MVDFNKRKASRSTEKVKSPSDIYSSLDRASDKGPLRRVQEVVLGAWDAEHRQNKDVIVKLHTGQGKTLIGLLILQAKINESPGRALYLCPNKLLVQQTLGQAKQFGIRTVAVNPDGSLPDGFLNGEAILVTTVQKLFNGRSRFGLDARSLKVEYVVLDDAHACIDAIKAACQVTIKKGDFAYQKLLELFEDDLREQGAGSFAEIQLDQGESSGPLLPVPYWAWRARQPEILRILAASADADDLKFVWPLLRDRLENCQCVLSSRELVVAPYLAPVEAFGSFVNATHRVFMTATVSDDSFLVKGLGLDPRVVINPLTDPNEKWSGEKMILVPSLIAEDLDQGFITSEFGRSVRGRDYGVVVLTPSFSASEGWRSAGALISDRNTIESNVDAVRSGSRDRTLVIANRYDGIDLPDDSCRILIMDGRPFAESLLDRYEESCRPESDAIASRVARSIEQGLGRAVRGERDYCVTLVIGADLVKAIRSRETRKHLSAQTLEQVEMAVENSELAREDVSTGSTPHFALQQLIKQCLGRNADWKDFYVERMNSISERTEPPKMLEVFSAELAAEREHLNGRPSHAIAALQKLLDSTPFGDAEKGWYLQEMARYALRESKARSITLQQEAHRKNRLLLKPEMVQVQKLKAMSQRRSESIGSFVSKFQTFEELNIHVSEVLSQLKFGVRADSFERAWDELGRLLGFQAERPDKEWNQGPDNLWVLKQAEYLLVECKNEVELTRAEINKHESGQMNNACAWFSKEYPGCSVHRVMVIPTAKLASAAGFVEEVRVVRKTELGRLVARVKGFYQEFAALDLSEVSEKRINHYLESHRLSVEHILEDCTTPSK